MEKIVSALKELQKINEAYNIPTENIAKLQADISEAKVCTPVIGKFSSGKSALVNTILGYSRKILREDITPETAIPAEIVYSDAGDSITILKNDGTCTPVAVNAYRNYEADAKTVKSARISLKNSSLEEIPDVMLVDMPGFESGFEIHNKAIDNYLPQSLAYIVTFPADDMIVRSSVGNILKELCLHDMPLCVAITKCDKKNDEFEATFKNLQDSLKRFVGDRKIRYCFTSSHEGDAEELEKFLKEIQEESQTILSKKFVAAVLGLVENTENYLKMTLNSSQLSESELVEKEDKLKAQQDSLSTKFSQEQTNFDAEVKASIEEIKGDLLRTLDGETETLVAMAVNNQELKDHLNNLVRNTVTISVKERLIPRIEKYLKRVTSTINAEAMGDVHISFNYDPDELNTGIVSSVVAITAGTLLGGPVLGLILHFIAKYINGKKVEEAKQRFRMTLKSEVYPKIMEDVGQTIDFEITKQVKMVNTSIENELKNQQGILEKALADIRGKVNDEKTKKDNLRQNITSDLEKLNAIKATLE